MSKVVDALRREHESIGRVLDVLDSEIADLSESQRGRLGDFDLVWQAIDYFIDFPDLVHHPKEDMIFERLRQIDPAAARDAGDLPASHTKLAQELSELARELKAAMERPEQPRGALIARARAFVQHQRQHMEREDAVFFPLAEHKLSDADWDDLHQRMIGRIDPLIDGQANERFEALRRIIVSALASKQPAGTR